MKILVQQWIIDYNERIHFFIYLTLKEKYVNRVEQHLLQNDMLLAMIKDISLSLNKVRQKEDVLIIHLKVQRYLKPFHQVDEALYRQTEADTGSQALVLTGDFNHPNTC